VSKILSSRPERSGVKGAFSTGPPPRTSPYASDSGHYNSSAHLISALCSDWWCNGDVTPIMYARAVVHTVSRFTARVASAVPFFLVSNPCDADRNPTRDASVRSHPRKECKDGHPGGQCQLSDPHKGRPTRFVTSRNPSSGRSSSKVGDWRTSGSNRWSHALRSQATAASLSSRPA